VHISELANYRVPTIEDEVNVGDEITVVVIKNEDGKIGLSRKAVFEKSSQVPGAKVEDSLSADYPFRRSGDHAPPRRNPPRDKPRSPDKGR
ncbi:unnamed protein product, partial [marine sediment metagenome]